MITDVIVKDLPLDARCNSPQNPAVLNPWARYEAGLLIGRVYNHPRLADGKVVVTSRVLELDARRGFARTLNTFYRLVNKSTVKDIMRLRREMRGQ